MNDSERDCKLASIALAMAAAGIIAVTSGCGQIALIADAEGMRAFSDYQNGLITNGKASPNVDTAHWKQRHHEETQVTQRVYAPSFLDKLTGNTVAAPPSEPTPIVVNATN